MKNVFVLNFLNKLLILNNKSYLMAYNVQALAQWE